MTKNKKSMFSHIVTFILGGLVFGSLGVYAATTLASNSVSYDNKTSGGSSTSVQGALDELYNKAKTCTVNEADSVVYLGNSTPINVSAFDSKASTYTADNFVVGATAISSGQVSYTSTGTVYTWSSSRSFELGMKKTYSGTTLTISGTTIRHSTCISNEAYSCEDKVENVSTTYFAYLSKKPIKNFQSEIAAGNKIEKNQLYYLGEGRSFDVSAYSDFKKLNTTNFLVGFVKSNTASASNKGSGKVSSSRFYGTTISRAYNDTNGVLTVSGGTYNIDTCISSTSNYYCNGASNTVNVTPFVYFIDGYYFP